MASHPHTRFSALNISPTRSATKETFVVTEKKLVQKESRPGTGPERGYEVRSNQLCYFEATWGVNETPRNTSPEFAASKVEKLSPGGRLVALS